ncbi:hypothetical protein F5887DRAFT_1085595 [Amanita rubescens]|nr:hypothetical protein F5887DRAFT_1085595 [Amanita rubescens]
MLRALPGRLCFRRLGRLPASCHHIAVRSAPRIPPSFGSKSYHNASFSARPNNLLAAKIWYRKDGVPRSKRKGVLFLFLALWAWASYEAVKVHYESQAAMKFLLHILLSHVDWSSMDLLTPRGALVHYRNILCAAVDKDEVDQLGEEFDDLIKQMDSGKFSSTQVQLLHLAAGQACFMVHINVELLQKSREDEVVMRTCNLRDVMFTYLYFIRRLADGEDVQKLYKFYKTISKEYDS